jgi:hypothetical protein
MIRPKGCLTLTICLSLAFFLLSSSIVSSIRVSVNDLLATSEGVDEGDSSEAEQAEEEEQPPEGEQQQEDLQQDNGNVPQPADEEIPPADIPLDNQPVQGDQPIMCSGVVNPETGGCEEVPVESGGPEICDNFVDDNLDGNIDESDCVTEGGQQTDASGTLLPSFTPSQPAGQTGEWGVSQRTDDGVPTNMDAFPSSPPGESSGWGLPQEDTPIGPTEEETGIPGLSSQPGSATSQSPIPAFSPSEESGAEGPSEVTESVSREGMMPPSSPASSSPTYSGPGDLAPPPSPDDPDFCLKSFGRSQYTGEPTPPQCMPGQGGSNSAPPPPDSQQQSQQPQQLTQAPTVPPQGGEDDDITALCQTEEGRMLIPATCDALLQTPDEPISTDSDGDGIPDTEDKCPGFYTLNNDDKDEDGMGDDCDSQDNRPPSSSGTDLPSISHKPPELCPDGKPRPPNGICILSMPPPSSMLSVPATVPFVPNDAANQPSPPEPGPDKKLKVIPKGIFQGVVIGAVDALTPLGLIIEVELPGVEDSGGEAYLATNTVLSVLDLKKGAKAALEHGPGIAKGIGKTIWTVSGDVMTKIHLMRNGKYLDQIKLPPAITRQALGQDVEDLVVGVVSSKYPNMKTFDKLPSTTGFDIPVAIPGLAKVGEVKPANAEGIRAFWKQLDNWTQKGDLIPGDKVALFVYDEAGHVYLYGVFTAKKL